jgi:phosphoglycerate dehydrogenase-like enzyme
VYWSRAADPARDAATGGHRVELEELFATSDVVSVHLTLTDETRGLVSRDLLGRLKPGAIFVNTARAGIVDTDALGELVASGALFGVGLDVFPDEPPQLASLPPTTVNAVLTPHVGFHTDEADDVFRLAGQNILAFAAGEPTNVLE